MGGVTVQRAVRGLLAGAIGIVLLGGCSASVSVGSGDKLDTGKAEDAVRNLLVGTPVEEVSCPERDLEEGDVFQCTAQVENQRVRVRVIQDDNEGNVSLERVDAILDVAQAVAFVEGQVAEATGSPVTADCGPQQFLVKEPGAEVECLVTPTSGGAADRAILTVEDVEGTVNLRMA